MDMAFEKLEEAIHDIASVKVGKEKTATHESDKLLAKLVALGTELWIDTGDLDLARSVWKNELTALTTNNTLANQVVQKGVMDETIRETVRRLKEVTPGLSEAEAIMEIGFVINCKIALRLVGAFHQKVSVELHPSVSRDIEKTVYYARRYFKVCPEFFIIKIPLTPEGYLSVRKLRKEGMPINFTLGFSARQNYLAARLTHTNYLNVFLGRLNQVVSENSMGTGKNVGEKVTLATQRAIRKLKKRDSAIHTKLIGASIRNGEQVAALAGLDVLTIPPAAMKEFLESGKNPSEIANTVENDPKPDIAQDKVSRFTELWEVSAVFKKFVETLCTDSKIDSLSGEEMVGICETHDIDLFHRFSAEDRKRIYDHGKIPRISDWPEAVALDDLMTQSALLSFAKDQDALDNRIRSFLK